MVNLKPQVCILAAGSGTRMGPYGELLNKALLPLNEKAIISHIIEKFPADSEFVVATGYKEAQVKAYLRLAHPQQKITFIDVENYNGPGSGPGHSLLCCRQALRDKFYLVAADTLWAEDVCTFDTEKSWMAVGPHDPEQSGSYCNLIVDHGNVLEIHDKVKTQDQRAQPFTALAFVRDSELFWQGLAGDQSQSEKQLAAGFLGIMRSQQVKVHQITWTDVGTVEKYRAEVEKDSKFDFSKTNEMFYRVNERVIKFFADPAITDNRVKKAGVNPHIFPAVIGVEASFYAYVYQPGETLYNCNSSEIFSELIDWLRQNLWKPHTASTSEIQKMCRLFYKEKTEERLRQYDNKYKVAEPERINGKIVPTVRQLLGHVNWENLFQGVPVFMHGDLQPDNIIFDARTGKFLLLDWRQDFAGETAFGDLYYDFAKLWAGLCLDYSRIKQNDFQYTEDTDNTCRFTVPSHPYVSENQRILRKFIENNGYSLEKTKILTALVFLNMSPLHHSPFDKMLHALGRVLLFEELQENMPC